jgi:hypothetical protein
LRNRINRLACAALTLALIPAVVHAKQPTVADLDAANRSAGNRKEAAMALGEAVFKTSWPAQVFRVSANGVGTHLVLGIGLYGVKFHRPISQLEFAGEVSELVGRAFTALPDAEEVDVWTVVPITVGKGVIVNGDLAKPTTRTVFTVSVPRGDAAHLLPSRLMNHPGVYWDEEWARVAFKEAH